MAKQAKFNLESFELSIKKLTKMSSPGSPDLESLTEGKRRSLSKRVGTCIENLEHIRLSIEGIKLEPDVFDLSNPNTAADMIVRKLKEKERIPLMSLEDQPFYGSGVYMIFYNGTYDAYEPISRKECPIYVGSASPSNKTAETPRKQKKSLYSRLLRHIKSIKSAHNLDLPDIDCKYLLVQTGLELAAEQCLIREYQPVWNKACKGFGKHGDVERKELSKWDILHGGRRWAESQTSSKGKNSNDVRDEIIAYFQELIDKGKSKF